MDDQLIIVIEYESAPSAQEVGALFTALARDYKDYTKGRVLAVAHIEHGSMIVTLKDWALVALPYVKDAVEFTKGAKALADFGKLLKEGLESLKGGKPKTLSSRRGRKTRAQRSIETMLRIAAANGRSIRVKHTSAAGENLEVEMSAPEASAILHEISAVELPGAYKESRHDPVARHALGPAAQVLRRLYEPSSATLSLPEAEGIVEVLLHVFRNAGLEYLLPSIASDFSSKGFSALAVAIEARLLQSGSDTEPPRLGPVGSKS